MNRLASHAAASNCPQCGSPARIAYQDVRDAWKLNERQYRIARCLQCRSLFIDPSPSDEKVAHAYQTGYYTHTGSVSPPNRRRLRRILHRINVSVFRTAYGYGQAGRFAKLLAQSPWVRRRSGQAMRFLRAKKDGKLLEVGCGDGAFLLEARRWGWNCWGLEPDREAAVYRLADGQIQLLNCGLEDMIGYESTFDAIVLHHVIEHVRDTARALKVLWNALAPGGQLVSISPNPEALGLRIMGRRWRGLEPPRHLLIPSQRLLVDLCRDIGFRPEVFTLHRNLGSYLRASLESSHGKTSWLALAGKAGAAVGMTLGMIGAGLGEEVVLIATK